MIVVYRARNRKQAKGPALALLNVIRRKGIEAIL
jgi:DNA-binding transcriptional regulator YiaG